MSKASEWAGRDRERTRRLEEAQRQIEHDLEGDAMPKPIAHKHAGVSHDEGKPTLRFRAYSTPLVLSAAEAIDLARWILDTFGEAP